MSFLGWEFKRQGDKAISRSRIPVSSGGVAAEADSDLLTTPILYTDQVTRYQQSDLVYMAVKRVAEMCSMNASKLKIFRPKGDRDPVTNLPETEFENHPFLDLWQNPNDWMSLYEFVEAWAITMQLSGNTYWHLDDGKESSLIKDSQGMLHVDRKGAPVNLWNVRPDLIVPVADKETYIKHYKFEQEGNKIIFETPSILHQKYYHPLKGLEGLSPIEPANWSSKSDIASQISNFAMFKNGLRLSGIVESERDEIDLDQKKMMEKEWDKKYRGGAEKAHQLMFLWSDFKYKDLGMNMRDAEYVEGSKLNRERILATFGVHPAILFSEGVNRANAEVGEYVTLKFTIAPLLRRLAGGLDSILRTMTDQPAEAHFVGVVPDDEESEAKTQNLQSQVMERLIRALGPDEGVEEAKRLGLLSEDVDAASVMPASFSVGFGGGDPLEDEKDEQKMARDYP